MTRDVDFIDRELRVLSTVRDLYGGTTARIDELLDERLQLCRPSPE